jgi:hypothetical protein
MERIDLSELDNAEIEALAAEVEDTEADPVPVEFTAKFNTADAGTIGLAWDDEGDIYTLFTRGGTFTLTGDELDALQFIIDEARR